ncbi:MAG: hypothetical protein ACHQYP_01055 [Nitrospiria bacterium]
MEKLFAHLFAIAISNEIILRCFLIPFKPVNLKSKSADFELEDRGRPCIRSYKITSGAAGIFGFHRLEILQWA